MRIRERRELASRLLYRFIWTGDTNWLHAHRRLWIERIAELALWYAAVAFLAAGIVQVRQGWLAASALLVTGALLLHAWCDKECRRLWQDLKQPISRSRHHGQP